MAFNWRAYAIQQARKYGVRPSLALALIRAESGGRQNAQSGAGAIGFTQLMPATAASLGVDPHDPRQNIAGGIRYLAQQLKAQKGDERLALAAYNAGPGAVAKYGGIPPYEETQTYVERVLGYSREGSGAADRGWTPAGGGGGSSSPAGVQSSSTGSADYRNRMSLIFDDDQEFVNALVAKKEREAPAPAAPAGDPGGSTTGVAGGVPPRRPGEPGWKWLQRIAMSKFGLRNDPGNSQTVGGRHSSGSEHYDERAIDFGDARNSRKQLQAWLLWAQSNGFDAIDEGDHIHVSLPGSGI